MYSNQDGKLNTCVIIIFDTIHFLHKIHFSTLICFPSSFVPHLKLLFKNSTSTRIQIKHFFLFGVCRLLFIILIRLIYLWLFLEFNYFMKYFYNGTNFQLNNVLSFWIRFVKSVKVPRRQWENFLRFSREIKLLMYRQLEDC